MSDSLFVSASIALILLAFFIIFLIDRRVHTRGPLFTGPASLGQRAFALFLAILFGAVFVGVLAAGGGSIHSPEPLLFPVLSVGLLAYALGARGWLDRLQHLHSHTTDPGGAHQGSKIPGPKRIRGLENTSPAELKVALQTGGRFVVFALLVSFLFFNYRRVSDIYFVRPGQRLVGTGILYTVLSLLFGWWSPAGLRETGAVLTNNLRGGLDITKDVARDLRLRGQEDKWRF